MLGSVQHGAGEQIALEWRECFPAEEGILRAFDALRHDAFPWLLDSALEGGRLGRFSFAGSDPYLVLRISGRTVEEHWRRPVREGSRMGHRLCESDPLTWIRRILPACDEIAADLPVDLPFVGGAVGYLGYEFNRTVKFVNPHNPDGLTAFADATLLMVDRLLALDHGSGRLFALGLGFGPSPEPARQNASRAVDALVCQLKEPTVSRHASGRAGKKGPPKRHELLSASPPAGLIAEFDEPEYTARIRLIKQQIAEGNVYQANLTNRMVVPFSGDPWDLYLALRACSPAPFACFMQVPDGTIVGSSPERFLKVSSGGEVESRPIKGTRPRGASPSEDAVLERALLSSAKDRAENLMIVDLMRNDLGRVCEIGTIRVPELMKIERYASVFQMVSTVTGTLHADRDALDLVGAAFPPGSMTGAPKIAAVSLLERLETVRRGVYSGALGYFDLRGGMDLSVVIRTLLVQKERACLQVGGAVVADSDPAGEFAEARDKARALWAALSTMEPVTGADGKSR